MEISLNKNGYSYYKKSFSQRIKKEETMDVVVPDTLPDIGEILETDGFLVIRSKDTEEGAARISASITLSVVYRAEDDNSVHSVKTSLPVEISAESESIHDSSCCTAQMSVSMLEARMLNPRKILVRGEVTADVCCYAYDKLELACGLGAEAGTVHIKTAQLSTLPAMSVREKTFIVTDEYSLPPAAAGVQELLAENLSASVDEIKFVGTKLVYKGTVNCSLLYNGTDASPAAAEFSTSFSQMIDCDALCTEPNAKVDILPTGIYFEVLSSGEGRIISAELHLLAQAVCYDHVMLTYIADAYSNVNSFSLTTEDVCNEYIVSQPVRRESIRESVEMPEPAADILRASTMTGAPCCEGDSAILPVSAHLLYMGNDGKVHGMRKRFDVEVPMQHEDDTITDVLSGTAEDISAAVSGSGADVRLNSRVSVMQRSCRAVKAISAIEYNENERKDISRLPSCVVMKAANDTDIWQLAKENCSNVEEIIRANGLDELTGEWEKYILIPKGK